MKTTTRRLTIRNLTIASAILPGLVTLSSCSSSDDGKGSGASGGSSGAGGEPASGGATTAGGTTASGGTPGPSGGTPSNGGAIATGGVTATGGSTSSGGATGSGGSTGGNGGDGGATGSGGAGGGSGGTSTGPFPPVTDFTKDGPFTATTVNDSGPNGKYTVFLPTPLAQGAKNPIVGWMSGGGTTPPLYPLLPRLATHGFVVIASNTVPGIGAEVALGQEIIAGIDWAIAENGRDGSQMFGKLDTTKLASMGYSMGSLATFTIANDPRLTTTVHISGGNMVADRVNNLHAPAAFICGIPGDSSCNILSGDCDIAAANCDTDFAGSKVPTFYANFPAGHLGILQAPLSDRIGATAIAWLRWKMMADTTLSTTFLGTDCSVCKEKDWKVQVKNGLN